MTPPPWADLLLVNLRWGRDGARTLGELAEAMSAPRRELEKAVEEMRVNGVPICSGYNGIWLTTDPAEMIAQYRALRSRYLKQAKNARILMQTAERYERLEKRLVQTTLFGEVS